IMLNMPEKTTEEIKSEFKNQFTSTISPKVKQFNKKRFILAIEGIVSLIIPAAMAYIFFVLEHPATPKDTNIAILSIIVCGSILPLISLYYYFCPDKIKEEEKAAKNILKLNENFNKALYEHGEHCTKESLELEDQVLALFRIKKSNYISQLKQNQLIEKLKSTTIFPAFDKLTRFNARITLGGLFVLKNTNDIGTKFHTSRNGCNITMRENSFYRMKPNDYYLVLLFGGLTVLTVTNCMSSNITHFQTIVAYLFAITLLTAYIIMIFVNSADQYKGVIVEIETPEKIYDGHAVLLPYDDKLAKTTGKLIREVKPPVKEYRLFINKTNEPKMLIPIFFSLMENIRQNFKPRNLRISIKDNSIIFFMETSSKKLNIFDWTRDMENSKTYEPFINRLLSLFNMTDFLSKKTKL
uniref:hypothetical protein n=1 Tax=Candidatus Scatousia sp. TaxID=3085663 RepID=UPI004027C1C8